MEYFDMMEENPNDFSRYQQTRDRLLKKSLTWLFSNSLHTNLEPTVKLLIKNHLYSESVLFCLNKA